MQTRLGIPIILRRVGLHGPKGIREIDMILDTGAVYTVIAWDVARDIGYDPAVSERRMSIVTANGVVGVPFLKVKRMEVAELSVEAVDVVCHDIPEMTGIEGLLGLSFLRHFRTLIDYPGGVLSIGP
jgi:clan AA aspartic protease (TIGR02281 family)